MNQGLFLQGSTFPYGCTQQIAFVVRTARLMHEAEISHGLECL